MRQWTWLLVGGFLTAAAFAGQDPGQQPPLPKAKLKLAPLLPGPVVGKAVQGGKQVEDKNAAGRGKAVRPAVPPGAAPGADPLPDGAVARLGALRGGRGSSGLIPHTLLYTSDGKFLVSADTRSLHLWDATTGREVHQFDGAAVPAGRRAGAAAVAVAIAGVGTITAHAVAVAPDGKTVAIYTSTGPRIRVWDVASGREVNDWAPNGTGTLSLAFSPDGKFLVGLRGLDSAAKRPSLTFWDAATGQQVQQVNIGDVGTTSSTSWLAYSRDGRALAAATYGRPVQLVEAATGLVRTQLNPALSGPALSTTPGAVVFAPDGRTLYSVTSDGIAAWDLTTGKERRRFGSAMIASPLSLSADGQLLAVRASDGVRLYDPATGRPRLRITDPAGAPTNNAFALSPDGTTLAAIDRTGVLHFWNTTTGRERNPGDGHAGPITLLAFAPDGQSLVSVSAEKVCAWDLTAYKQQSALDELVARPRLQVLSPDGRRLALVGATSSVRVVEVPGGKVVRQLDDITSGPFGLAYTADGNTLAVSEGKAVKLWDLATGAAKRTIDASPNTVTLLAFSSDGRRLAGTGGFGGMQVWDTESGRQLWEQPVPGIACRSAPVFSADGTRVTYAGLDGQVRVFDGDTGKEVVVVEGSAGPIPAVAFSPDGQRLATGGSERQVHVWDITTGRLLRTLTGHQGSIESLAYSADGTLLASGGSDAVVYLWDATRFGPKPSAGAGAAAEPELNDAQLTKLWDELSDSDAAKAYAAMGTLTAAPQAATTGLRARLKPAESPDAQKVAQLLADLDSERFDRREKATRDLAALGDSVRGALEKFLVGTASTEARMRAQELLKNTEHPARSPEMLRQMRAVEVLEWIGTPEARALLTELAKGADGARLTREAQVALERLKKQ